MTTLGINWSLGEPEPATCRRIDEATIAAAKSTICRVIAACPVHRWARLSAIVRRLWSGFRNV